jgi:hypothetical protein
MSPCSPRPCACAVSARAVLAGADIVAPREERWYRVDVATCSGREQMQGRTVAGNRQLVLAEP